jgi:hypothetical protein
MKQNHRRSHQKPWWENKFRRPSAEALVADCPAEVAAVLGWARAAMVEEFGLREEVDWLGLPWRWTLVYRLGGNDSRAFGYLVPNPGGPQIAVPLPREVVEALPARRMKRPVRDGIAQARIVGGVHWPVWDLSSRAQLDDVLDVVRQKRRMVQGTDGRVVAPAG